MVRDALRSLAYTTSAAARITGHRSGGADRQLQHVPAQACSMGKARQTLSALDKHKHRHRHKRGMGNARCPPASPEQPSQWPMLDLTEPMSSGSAAERPAPLPYTKSMAASSCASPTTVPVPCAST